MSSGTISTAREVRPFSARRLPRQISSLLAVQSGKEPKITKSRYERARRAFRSSQISLDRRQTEAIARGQALNILFSTIQFGGSVNAAQRVLPASQCWGR